MTVSSDRQPIIVADAGPLIRLAAAGLLDALRGLNRRLVLVDRKIGLHEQDRNSPVLIDNDRGSSFGRPPMTEEAVRALDAIAEHHDLKPAMIAEIDPGMPTDLRELRQPFRWE
jgi:hypothetical protein